MIANIFPQTAWSLPSAEYGVTSVGQSTLEYTDFARLLNAWFQQSAPDVEGCPDGVPCTSICINTGYGAKRHRDKNNVGPSWSKAFGNFRGGKLKYFYEDDASVPTGDLDSAPYALIDLRAGLCLFDGHCAHEVTPYTTTSEDEQRYSLVFYTNRHVEKADGYTHRLLEECGFIIPTDQSMRGVAELLDFPKHAGVASKPIHARIYVQPDTHWSDYADSPYRPQENGTKETTVFPSCPATCPAIMPDVSPLDKPLVGSVLGNLEFDWNTHTWLERPAEEQSPPRGGRF